MTSGSGRALNHEYHRRQVRVLPDRCATKRDRGRDDQLYDRGGADTTTIPARLDRLGWSPFHTRMVAGLGAAWILDGLQITIASSVTGVLVQPATLDMTATQVGLIASVYLVARWSARWCSAACPISSDGNGC